MTVNQLHRIAWRHKDSGTIPVMGASKAANHGIVLDPFYVDELNEAFPDLIFTQQIYIGGEWVAAYIEE